MATSGSQPILRASATMYALFGGIIGAVIVLAAVVAIMKEPALWIPTIAMVLILTGMLFWLGATTLKLENDAIHYRSLFVTKNLPLADIAKARFVVGPNAFGPYQRLVVSMRGLRDARELTINVGLFDRVEVKRWVAALDELLARDETSNIRSI